VKKVEFLPLENKKKSIPKLKKFADDEEPDPQASCARAVGVQSWSTNGISKTKQTQIGNQARDDSSAPNEGKDGEEKVPSSLELSEIKRSFQNSLNRKNDSDIRDHTDDWHPGVGNHPFERIWFRIKGLLPWGKQKH